MSILNKIQSAIGQLGASVASLIKVALWSGKPSPAAKESRTDTLIVMGNGPSLRTAIERHRDVLMAHPRLGVNLSALTPDFKELRPQYYILADIAFFVKEKSGKVPALWEALADVDWDMTLFLPVRARKMEEVKKLPSNITVKYYNLTPAEGFKALTYPLYESGLAMPRPRNVLIPAIMCGVREGFKKIALIGADHNWSKTLWVTERNCVVSVQPHFYKDDDAELRRAEEIFKNVRIHEVYENYAIAFKSYHQLKPWLDRKGVMVLNTTERSFIDAFPRADFSSLSTPN